jgi:hypothetical protein
VIFYISCFSYTNITLAGVHSIRKYHVNDDSSQTELNRVSEEERHVGPHDLRSTRPHNQIITFATPFPQDARPTILTSFSAEYVDCKEEHL